MANTTLPLLTAAASAADADIFLLRKSGETVDKKITGLNLQAYIQSGYQTTAAADAKYQPLNAKLTSLSGVTMAADQIPYFTSATAVAATSLTSFGRSIISGANAGAVRTTLGLGTIATQNANSVTLTGGSATGVSITGLSTPTNGSDAATKDYVDASAAGMSQKNAVRAATTAALTATYSNGTAGVGATLTNSGAQAAFALDGVSLAAGNRVLIKDQASTFQNGIYTVTTVGSGASNWVLTRATDFDAAAEISEGAYTIVEEGTANTGNLGTLWIQTNSGPFTVGTTAITWTQLIVAPQTKTFTGDVTGTGTSSIALTIGANKVTNGMIRQSAALSVIGNTTNATANVADIAAGADGNVLRRSGTAIGFGAIALASSAAVSGILAGANGGTGNGFFAITGPTTSLKTFTLPNASTTILTTNAAVTGAQGGTGQTTTAVGDLLQGAAANTWAKLSAVATGNVLISGGVTTASSWGKVGLTTHVTGTLAEGNGGVNQTTYAQGDMLYASATNTLSKLTVGAAKTFLQGGTTPSWAGGPLNYSNSVYVREEQTAGTNGGGNSVGLNTRTLNTTVWNNISGASLASNQLTLPAGTYFLEAFGPTNATQTSKVLIYNVTDAVYVAEGAAGNAFNSGQVNSCIGVTTIASTKVFEVRHFLGVSVGGTGLGLAANSGTEVYGQLIAFKVA